MSQTDMSTSAGVTAAPVASPPVAPQPDANHLTVAPTRTEAAPAAPGDIEAWELAVINADLPPEPAGLIVQKGSQVESLRPVENPDDVLSLVEPEAPIEPPAATPEPGLTPELQASEPEPETDDVELPERVRIGAMDRESRLAILMAKEKGWTVAQAVEALKKIETVAAPAPLEAAPPVTDPFAALPKSVPRDLAQLDTALEANLTAQEDLDTQIDKARDDFEDVSALLTQRQELKAAARELVKARPQIEQARQNAQAQAQAYQDQLIGKLKVAYKDYDIDNPASALNRAMSDVEARWETIGAPELAQPNYLALLAEEGRREMLLQPHKYPAKPASAAAPAPVVPQQTTATPKPAVLPAPGGSVTSGAPARSIADDILTLEDFNRVVGSPVMF